MRQSPEIKAQDLYTLFGGHRTLVLKRFRVFCKCGLAQSDFAGGEHMDS